MGQAKALALLATGFVAGGIIVAGYLWWLAYKTWTRS